LERGSEIPDLVEEDRAAFGSLEAALARLSGSGERALLVPEQLRLEKGVRNGSAVDRYERLVGAPTPVVDREGGELLAGAALAGDQDRNVASRDATDHPEDASDASSHHRSGSSS
jgi:hypothetical protein